jgi:hypothetical protein
MMNTRTHKTYSKNDVNNSRKMNHSAREQQSASPAPAHERRTHTVIREPVDATERAMDIAIGGEGRPWVERRKTG